MAPRRRALILPEAGSSASRVHGLRLCPESLRKPYPYAQPWQSLASQTAKKSVAVSGFLVLRNKRRSAKLGLCMQDMALLGNALP
jgi:hypothetical protein